MNRLGSEGQRVSRRSFIYQAGSAGLALGVASESSYGQSGGKRTMKITGIQTYKFSVPTGQEIRDPKTGELISSKAKPWLFLKITTDSGIVGWGEGSGEWLVPSVEATLHEWKPLLIGQDPLGVVRLTEDIQNRLPWKGGATFGTAIAAINIALYDIAGKAWGGAHPHHPGRPQTPQGQGLHRGRPVRYSPGGCGASPKGGRGWLCRGQGKSPGNPDLAHGRGCRGPQRGLRGGHAQRHGPSLRYPLGYPRKPYPGAEH